MAFFVAMDKQGRNIVLIGMPGVGASTVGILVAEAVTILRLIPGTTIIDVSVLLITGFLAGLSVEIQR